MPFLLLSEQMGPYLQGFRMQALGAGLVWDLSQSKEERPQLMECLLLEPEFKDKARAFAQANQGATQEVILGWMRSSIEAICKRPWRVVSLVFSHLSDSRTGHLRPRSAAV